MKPTILKACYYSYGSELRAAEWHKGQLHCLSVWSDGNTLPEPPFKELGTDRGPRPSQILVTE